jgi:hypothetical protein
MTRTSQLERLAYTLRRERIRHQNRNPPPMPDLDGPAPLTDVDDGGFLGDDRSSYPSTT